jgi:hypothetical protein
VFSAGPVWSQSKPEQIYKAGDTVYVCGCGAGCDCGSISKNVGKCGCGKDLLKPPLPGGKRKIYYMMNGKELSAPASGKYMCACGPGCKCGTISQKPGTCSCGKPMKKAPL